MEEGRLALGSLSLSHSAAVIVLPLYPNCVLIRACLSASSPGEIGKHQFQLLVTCRSIDAYNIIHCRRIPWDKLLFSASMHACAILFDLILMHLCSWCAKEIGVGSSAPRD